MFLKSLKLTGFKSFADRTRLDLRPGLTVVVGPNGSGKSNVVDALAWVLGNQSPKILRTDRMDDVIFSGTATRPGLSRAEVTLVLDNASGSMALDLPEVSLTRRVYRDGSSDYEINGVGCRLLDIQELLSDSGVGKSQHVIIGQGQIDSVLNAGPDDHRAVIEEAAGILKHRIRKDKAIRRLERTDGDVLRLSDILGELTRQMRPLKRQAAAAAKHGEVEQLAHALRLYVGGSGLVEIETRSEEVEQQISSIDSRSALADEELVDVRSALSILRNAAGEVGRALERDSAAAARLETTAERLRRIGSVAHERAHAARGRVEGADERLKDLISEKASLTRELSELESHRPSLQRMVEEEERRFRYLEDEERSLTDQESMTSEGAVAVVRGDLRSLDAAFERDTRELEAVESRMGSLSERRSTEQAERNRINDEVRDLDARMESTRGSYATSVQSREHCQRQWEELDRHHGEASVGLARAKAQLAGLEQAASGLADPAARSIAETSSGALGSLLSRLDVPPDLAAAVDAALGPWSDAVLYADDETTAGAVDRLKAEGRGGVPMVPSPAVSGIGSPIDQTAAAVRRAVELGAEPLVELLGSHADAGVAAHMFGDVLLVASWSLGWRIVRAEPVLRVVTPEGDLITSVGVRVAHPDGATPAMIETAGVEVEVAERELARTESLLMQARRTFDESRHRERLALEALEAIEAQVAGATEAMARLERLIQSVDEDLSVLDGRRQALTTTQSERREIRTRLLERLASLEGEEAQRQRAWDALVARRREVSAQRETARADWQELSSQLRAADDHAAMVQRRLDTIFSGIEEERTAEVDPASLGRLDFIEETAYHAVEAVHAHVLTLRTRQAELRSRGGLAGTRIEALQLREDRLLGETAELSDRRSDLAIELAELRVRRETTAEGLRRDLDVDEASAKRAVRPDLGDDVDLDAELRRVETELRRMGPINPLAAEEYAELANRHEFLTAQMTDLERARNELRSVVTALDEEIQQRFTAAFEEAAHAFEQHFATLFPGGSGRLSLVDETDPLRSGVEIEAQPHGKKVTKMSLLSGGERSLAALAFLFAVFRARPSPFYVLDEVEAALDDANLRRFLRLIEAFRADAQLIVVTHQQQTMEAADVLYGVTMEPGGSSTVVAKALTDVPGPGSVDAEMAAGSGRHPSSL